MGYDSACAVASDDRVYCWGSDADGQLGNGGLFAGSSSVPVSVSTSGVLNGKSIESVSVGRSSACAVDSDGRAYCWGRGNNGQLGNGSALSYPAPVSVSRFGALLGKTIKSVSVGNDSACAVASDDRVYCWGNGANGRLGHGWLLGSPSPVAVSTSGALSSKAIKSVSVGNGSACAVASDDRVYCWGNGADGRLGTGSTGSSSVPVAVSASGALSGKSIKSVSVGHASACAVTSAGSVLLGARRVRNARKWIDHHLAGTDARISGLRLGIRTGIQLLAVTRTRQIAGMTNHAVVGLLRSIFLPQNL